MPNLIIPIECGETTCASEPGKFCRFLWIQKFGTEFVCGIFSEPGTKRKPPCLTLKVMGQAGYSGTRTASPPLLKEDRPVRLSDILADREAFIREIKDILVDIEAERANNEALRAARIAEVANQTPEQRCARIAATGLIVDDADLAAWVSRPCDSSRDTDWLDGLAAEAQEMGFYD